MTEKAIALIEQISRKAVTMANEADEDEALLPLIGNIERPAIEEIIKGVRVLFRREDITAQQMHNLAVLLFGLEALPCATPGLNATLLLSYRSDNEMTYCSVDLDETTFELSTGGSVYTEGVGSDSFGETQLMVETTGYRDAREFGIAEWLVGFKQRLHDAEISVDLDDGCEIDWTAEPDESAWERAWKRYAEEEPNYDQTATE
jgi:hypothetical protein